MTGSVYMDFCDSCRLYRLCIAETETTLQGTQERHYCIEHRSDYREWDYAITMRHNRLVIVASGNTQSTIKAYPDTLTQARTLAQGLARPGEKIIEMLPDDFTGECPAPVDKTPPTI